MKKEKLKEEIVLDEDLRKRLTKVQEMLKASKNRDMSINEIIAFINYAMNYDSFQIELAKREISSEKVSSSDKIRDFLSQTDDMELLRLYDIIQNYDEVNIANVRRSIVPNNSEASNHQSGVVISEKSRKILVKRLLN